MTFGLPQSQAVETEERFLGEVATAASFIGKEYRHKSAILLHHNDADGIASGAILSTVFSRMGMRIARYCLEKPFPVVVERLLEERDEPLIVVADFGSGMISHFERSAPEDTQLLVLDHHQLEAGSKRARADTLIVNPISSGIDTTTTVSAATVCAFFAMALSPDNADLAWMGVLGWRGDGQEDRGLNHRLVTIARERGDITGDCGREVVAKGFSLGSLIAGVNALGAFDYLQGGPDIAMKGLMSGNLEGLLQVAAAAENRYREALSAGSGIVLAQDESDVLQWFTLGESFASFGVKTVGLVCEDLIVKGRAAEDRYLVGFQRVTDAIPGIGPVAINQVKVSMRLPQGVADRVNRGEAPPLTEILPIAAREIGGFVDGCHPHAAAVSIDPGKEQQLLEGIARWIRSWQRS